VSEDFSLHRGYRRYPQENHYYCDRERREDWNGNNPVPIPTMDEASSFLGPPPQPDDLPEWLTADPPAPKVQPSKEFFIILPEALLNDHELNSRDREVWAKYYRYSQPKDPLMISSGATFVSQERIARELNCSLETVRKSTVKLVKTGWILIQERPGRSNLTTVNWRKQRI
jgi:biotin operon repressor